jgi:hypothetical protein
MKKANLSILGLIGVILTTVGLLYLLSWYTNATTEYMDCAKDSDNDIQDCMTGLITSSPPVQTAKEFDKACDSDLDYNCSSFLAKQLLSKIAKEKAKEELPK